MISTPRRPPRPRRSTALAAGAIVVHRTWLYDGGGRLGAGSRLEQVFLNLALGVTLFFALSGFLLYRPFAAAIARGAPLPGLGRYLRNPGPADPPCLLGHPDPPGAGVATASVRTGDTSSPAPSPAR